MLHCINQHLLKLNLKRKPPSTVSEQSYPTGYDQKILEEPDIQEMSDFDKDSDEYEFDEEGEMELKAQDVEFRKDPDDKSYPPESE